MRNPLEELVHGFGEDRDFTGDADTGLDAISDAVGRYLSGDRHNVRDVVQWKRGMKDKKLPAYGQPGIVIEESYENPVFDKEENSGSPHFHEPLTIRIAFIDPRDGDLMAYWFDGSRFEKVEL